MVRTLTFLSILLACGSVFSNEPIAWLSPQRYYYNQIIPENELIASYRIQNTLNTPIILSAYNVPRECMIKDIKMTPIAPNEITEIKLGCRFTHKLLVFREVSFVLSVHSVNEDNNYKLALAGSVSVTNTFNEYADQTYRKYENAMTVHIRRPPTDINWVGKPRDILLDLANNRYLQSDRSRMPIGHVTIELNCTDAAQNKIRRIGGQGMKSINDFTNKILKEGYGFSVLIQPKDKKGLLSYYPTVTVNGRFENEEAVGQNNDQGIWEPDLMGFATFLVQPQECQQMVEFFDLYVQQTESDEDMAGNRYGFGADPGQYQGAGCATFVEEFFKRSGISFYQDLFYQKVHVPLALFGDPDHNLIVGLTDLVMSGEYLSRTNKQSVDLSFPDPNVLYQVVKNATKNKVISNGMRLLKKGKFGDSEAIYSVFDTHECLRNLCI